MQALFVHGMGRTPVSGLPLLHRLAKNGVSAQRFFYVCAWQSFDEIVARLRMQLCGMAEQGPYVVIGHSLGGILLRAALMQCASHQLPAKLFLLGSPQRASRLALKWRANIFYRLLTGDCGQLLADDARMQSIGAPAVPTIVIAGDRHLFLTKHIFGNEINDGIVGFSELQCAQASEHVVVSVAHSLMGVSKNVSDSIALRLPAIEHVGKIDIIAG